MSARALAVTDFVAELRARIPLDIHPMAARHIHDWLDRMRATAEPAELAHLLSLVHAKTAEELRWEAEKHRTGGDYRTAYRLERRADRLRGRP